MVDSTLGEKRVCPECAAKFYDMNKKPATCPKCGTSFTPQAAPRPSIPGKKKPASKAKPKPQPAFDDVPEGDFKEDEELAEALEEMDEGESIESISELEDREVEEDRVNSDDVDDDVLIDEVEPDQGFVEGIDEDDEEEKE